MSDNKAVDRDTFLKPPAPVIKAVPVPEFGEGAVIHVKGLTAKEWSVYEAGMLDKDGFRDPKKNKEARARLVVHGCVNPDGSRMFAMTDLPLMQEQLIGVIDRINDAIWEASGRNVPGNSEATTDEEPLTD